MRFRIRISIKLPTQSEYIFSERAKWDHNLLIGVLNDLLYSVQPSILNIFVRVNIATVEAI